MGAKIWSKTTEWTDFCVKVGSCRSRSDILADLARDVRFSASWRQFDKGDLTSQGLVKHAVNVIQEIEKKMAQKEKEKSEAADKRQRDRDQQAQTGQGSDARGGAGPSTGQGHQQGNGEAAPNQPTTEQQANNQQPHQQSTPGRRDQSTGSGAQSGAGEGQGHTGNGRQHSSPPSSNQNQSRNKFYLAIYGDAPPKRPVSEEVWNQIRLEMLRLTFADLVGYKGDPPQQTSAGRMVHKPIRLMAIYYQRIKNLTNTSNDSQPG